MEERRLLVAVALSLLILTGYSLLFGPEAQPPAPETPGTEAATPATPAPTTASPGHPGPTPAEAAAEPTAEPVRPAVPTVAAELEQRVEVEAEDFSIAFSNRGARVLSWKLARYLSEEGRPEEMVPSRSREVRPLDLETGDPGVDETLRNALFRPTTTTLTVSDSSPRTLGFEFSDGRIRAEKSLTFQGSGLISVVATVEVDGQGVPVRLVWGPGIGNEAEIQGYTGPQGVTLVQGEVERFAADDLEPGGQALLTMRWAGVEGRFFAALMIPSEGLASGVLRPVMQPGDAEEEPTAAVVAAVDVTPGIPLLLFVGAKDHQALSQLGFGLEKVVPVGDWIGPIVVPLMRLLRWVHSLVGNWGWAIVILTVMINMLMAPLRHYSIANGMKMAKMQPEMKVIQERYRKVPMMDPRRQKMQEEMGVRKIRFPDTSGIGVKPISREGTERLVRKAMQYAIDNDRRSVTLVHKGNIMKFTEGAFRDWGYELAQREFDAQLLDGGPWCQFKNPKTGRDIIVKDAIADAFLQQILLRPAEYDVIATMNLNGDYVSDALAAQVGGIGIAPGANISDSVGLFEATHGTAPKYAGQDKVNPGSLILSAEMMLRHMGWTEAADLIVRAMEAAIGDKIVTYDFARLMDGAQEVSCSQFGNAMIERM